MNSVKADSNGVLELISIPKDLEKRNPLQLSHYIVENGENAKGVKHKENLENNQMNLDKVNDFKQTLHRNEEIYSLKETPTFKNKIPSASLNLNSDAELKAINEDITKVLVQNDCLDISKIYISCRFCKKGFETVKNLSNHDCRKTKINSKIKMHKCKFCSLSFSKIHNLNVHIKGHKRNNCTLCMAQFTKRKALCKHLRAVHNVKESEKSYKCSFCDKHFAKKLSLNFHLKSHINNQYFCLTCCFMCDEEDAYNDHVKQHMEISKYECHLCKKKFVRRQQYDQHMMAHERCSCSSCNVTFSNKKLLIKHQNSIHKIRYEKKYACLICQKLFDRPKNLEIHQRVHTGEKPVNCSCCEKNFANSKSLLKHMKTVTHLQRVSNQQGQIIEVEKPFLCSKCGARFYRQQSLLRHIEIIHSAMEYLKCSHCEYKSKYKANFKRHLDLHTDMKRFVCEHCGSSFRSLATLKEHYVFVHSENREFICNVCKKSFKNKSTLQRHMRIHSENRPYKCYCDRDYKRLSHLKRHMISAHQMTFKKNQTPVITKEQKNLTPSLSDENIAAFIKSLEAIPDESSCDDFPVSHYIMAATALNDLNINVEACEKQLPKETVDDGNFATHSKLIQKLPVVSCDVSVISEDPENTSSTLKSQHLKIQPTTILTNSETSSTSVDDITLSLSPSNYCNFSSPLNSISIENVTALSDSILSHNVNSLISIDNIINETNLNFQTLSSNIDSFASFSLQNSDSSSSPSTVPSFLLNGGISSPSHVSDLNLEQNSSQKQLFGASEDFLSLPSCASSSNELETNCSPEPFFHWDVDENSNTLKISYNDLAISNTCANIFFPPLTCNANNLLQNDLFENDALDVTALNSEFDTLSNLC